jgi:AcrR family transcriptional regulator
MKSQTEQPLPLIRKRNRAETIEAILRAAQNLLADKGFQNFGVNAVAKAAGCDKQLIYRYFGGLDGLVEAIGEGLAGWIDQNVPLPPPGASYAEAVRHLLQHYCSALAASPLMQRILVWEMAESSDLVVKLGEARSRALGQWVRTALANVAPPPAEVDAPATNALLIAAAHQLIIARSMSGRFAGIDVADDDNFERAMQALQQMAVRTIAGDAAQQN